MKQTGGQVDVNAVAGHIGAALDENLTMHPFKGAPPGDCVYVGLWSAWTIGGEAPAAKILFATVPAAAALPTPGPALLGDLPWRILQFQHVRQTDKIDDPAGRGTLWEGIRQTLSQDFQELEGPDNNNECTKRVFFEAHAEVHATRRIQNRDWLTQALIERVDDKSADKHAAPIETPARAIVKYQVRRLPLNAATSDGTKVSVYIERNMPKNTTLGQLIHRESGFIRESNLLAALEEWRTWICLASGACHSDS